MWPSALFVSLVSIVSVVVITVVNVAFSSVDESIVSTVSMVVVSSGCGPVDESNVSTVVVYTLTLVVGVALCTADDQFIIPSVFNQAPFSLQLLAAKHSHSSNRAATSYLNEYNPAFPSDLSDDDVNQLWLDPGLARIDNSPTSGGSRMLSSEEEGEGEDAMLGSSQVKRFHPSAFFGSRGKRMYGGLSSAYAKRFQQGLLASRAERLPYSGGEGQQVAKRFDPSGFSGSRGKRYMPGLEALFLSQMYKKCEYNNHNGSTSDKIIIVVVDAAITISTIITVIAVIIIAFI